MNHKEKLESMDSLFSHFSILANEALNNKNFNPSQIEELLDCFEREAYKSFSAAEAENRRAAEEAEASMKEAEKYLNSLLDDAMNDFHRSCKEIELSSKSAQKMSGALGSAAIKYMDGALASAMATTKSAFAATKISKIHPS